MQAALLHKRLEFDSAAEIARSRSRLYASAPGANSLTLFSVSVFHVGDKYRVAADARDMSADQNGRVSSLARDAVACLFKPKQAPRQLLLETH